ncbi:MAG: HigA family addiction module antitoxin [Pseudomonadota bacterium]
MEPLQITPSQFADMMKLPRNKINEIINKQQAITSDIAIRLGKVFGTSMAQPSNEVGFMACYI